MKNHGFPRFFTPIQKRGISSAGHAANDVETEQVVLDESLRSLREGHVLSYVQVPRPGRGAVEGMSHRIAAPLCSMSRQDIPITSKEDCEIRFGEEQRRKATEAEMVSNVTHNARMQKASRTFAPTAAARLRWAFDIS